MKQENAIELGESLKIVTTSQGIEVSFPETFNQEEIEGTISLYRPSNQALDQIFPLKLTSNNLLIPKSNLVDGRWDITLDFQYQGKEYQKQQTLML